MNVETNCFCKGATNCDLRRRNNQLTGVHELGAKGIHGDRNPKWSVPKTNTTDMDQHFAGQRARRPIQVRADPVSEFLLGKGENSHAEGGGEGVVTAPTPLLDWSDANNQ